LDVVAGRAVGAGRAVTDPILVVNAGSSSLKLRLLDGDDSIVEQADLPADAGGFDRAALEETLRGWPRPGLVGHRVVHGGTEFSSAVVVDAGTRRRIEALTDLAPLHQPKSLAGLDAVSTVLADVPAVACFDTAFHSTIPPEAATYAVPREWRERYGVRRFGFHGLSHAYAARRGRQLAGAGDSPRTVVCHLGAGASLCAVRDGRSVDTTMGFTPLEGLVMATRSGSVDPGLVLWLEEHEQLTPHEVATALEERSGLAALTGTPDMRQVQARADAGDSDARLGMNVYLHRLAAGIAAMVAALGGLELLVFTGGVGEHSSAVRSGAADRLRWLGVALDQDRNAGTQRDHDIGADGAAVRTVVVTAREDLQIARECRAVTAS
jgi:acetate kinase